MNTRNFKTVYRAEGMLQAMIVKTFLEQAGISAALAAASRANYLDVQVPLSHAKDARSLLNRRPQYGEILYPAAMM